MLGQMPLDQVQHAQASDAPLALTLKLEEVAMVHMATLDHMISRTKSVFLAGCCGQQAALLSHCLTPPAAMHA